MNEAVNWCIALVAGFLLGGLVQRNYSDELEKENRALLKERAVLDYECPDGEVKIATQKDGGPWVTKCVGSKWSKTK